MKDFGDGDCLYTIGYGGKSAQEFFALLAEASVERLIDVRLYNTSQLVGFAGRDNLASVAMETVGAEYMHVLQWAPTKEILADYKKAVVNWTQYEQAFNELIASRQIETVLNRRQLTNACLLCAEAKATHCHRRLVAEYLSNHWKGIKIIHL